MNDTNSNMELPLRATAPALGRLLPCLSGWRHRFVSVTIVRVVIPRLPVRQGLLSFPIPLRLLFAIHPQWLAPVLQIVHRVIATFLIQHAGLQRTEAHTGAVTLISVSDRPPISIHLHCLVLDGVYRTTQGLPVFHTVHGPTATELEALLT